MFVSKGVLLATVMCLGAAPITPTPARAQQSPRSGFSFSLGLGNGSAGVTCDGCGQGFDDAFGDRINGLSGYALLGAFVAPALLVGVEGTGWIKNSEGFQRRIAAVSLAVLAYPFGSADFFLRGGLGGIRAVIESGPDYVAGTGLTWQAGAGYDVPLGDAVALTPFVTYVGSSQVAADLDGASLGVNLNPDILQYGLALKLR